jgi:hypothetical protein
MWKNLTFLLKGLLKYLLEKYFFCFKKRFSIYFISIYFNSFLFKAESFYVIIDAHLNKKNNQLISATVKCEPKLNNVLINVKETLFKVKKKKFGLLKNIQHYKIYIVFIKSDFKIASRWRTLYLNSKIWQ